MGSSLVDGEVESVREDSGSVEDLLDEVVRGEREVDAHSHVDHMDSDVVVGVEGFAECQLVGGCNPRLGVQWGPGTAVAAGCFAAVAERVQIRPIVGREGRLSRVDRLAGGHPGEQGRCFGWQRRWWVDHFEEVASVP